MRHKTSAWYRICLSCYLVVHSLCLFVSHFELGVRLGGGEIMYGIDNQNKRFTGIDLDFVSGK